MEILRDVSLLPYNTFRLDVKAKALAEFHTEYDLRELIQNEIFQEKNLILGGGSNVLFSQDFDGLVALNRMKGIEVLEEDEESVLVRFMAGENWHEAVMHSIEQGWGGIENLSLIPGNVGAAPMQNIGAYGVELVQVFECLRAMAKDTGEIKEFGKEDCEFGYRTSIFKTRLKEVFVICSVDLRLSKRPVLNTSYGAIQEKLEGIVNPTIRDVSNAVIAIRRSKLPDPAQIGNAGSFFKNPVVSYGHFLVIRLRNPQVPSYMLGEGRVKIPAGWLIEQCGWKGKDLGGYGVHDRQALVLVNRGGGSGEAINQLSKDIQESVFERFHIELEREVNLI
jgi:UDP-N-acetylmuramate dehydrogenase